MFDFAWSEMALIAVVALIVIGPKDLPRVLRTVGIWVGRARAVAREFQGSLEQMIREAELDDVRKEVERAASLDLKQEIEKSVDPSGELRRSLSESIAADPLATDSAANSTAVAAGEAALADQSSAVAPETAEQVKIGAPDHSAMEAAPTKSNSHA